MSHRILLLSECGSEIGFGHLTRCASLAHAFREAGYAVELWLAVEEALLRRIPADVRRLNWYDLSGELAREVERADAVIVDSMVVTAPQLERIAQINSRLAILDDWIRRSHRQGIVIDWTIGAERYAYPHRHPDVCYLLGSRYCSLRPEFSSKPQRSFPEVPRAVLVTFGGSDIRHLTGPVLQLLDADFPSLTRHVVVGGGVRDKSFMREWIGDTRTKFHIDCNAAQLRDLMAATDFAICAGGQTLYELASQELPAVAICVVDNQQDDIRGFSELGFAAAVGDWNKSDMLPSLANAIRLVWSRSERQRRANIGSQSVDGLGVQRLVAACLNEWSRRAAHA